MQDATCTLAHPLAMLWDTYIENMKMGYMMCIMNGKLVEIMHLDIMEAICHDTLEQLIGGGV